MMWRVTRKGPDYKATQRLREYLDTMKHCIKCLNVPLRGQKKITDSEPYCKHCFVEVADKEREHFNWKNWTDNRIPIDPAQRRALFAKYAWILDYKAAQQKDEKDKAEAGATFEDKWRRPAPQCLVCRYHGVCSKLEPTVFFAGSNYRICDDCISRQTALRQKEWESKKGKGHIPMQKQEGDYNFVMADKDDKGAGAGRGSDDDV